jgi:AraC-like DNA-binding protein
MSDGLYREAPAAPDLASLVRCLWYRRIGRDEALRAVRIVPDGCMDLMWRDGELTVAGPDTTAQVSRMPAGTEFVGLRFRPGAAAPVLGVPASELVDQRADALAIWGRRAGELVGRLEAARLAAADGWSGRGAPPEARAVAAILQDVVRRRLAEAPGPDRAVQHLVASVQRQHAIRIERLADRVGLSERQLHRRCCAALGYGPRTFAGIVRFQRFLADAGRSGRPTLAEAALRSGYADQPHLTREVRRLAGLTPAQLIAEIAR